MYGSPHSVNAWAAAHKEKRRRRRNREFLALAGFAALAVAVETLAAVLWR